MTVDGHHQVSIHCLSLQIRPFRAPGSHSHQLEAYWRPRRRKHGVYRRYIADDPAACCVELPAVDHAFLAADSVRPEEVPLIRHADIKRMIVAA